ncbi:MAG: hypothetical protein P8J33_02675 [Pirellulaceae bacterium]|nr:hypothetical protein [Pirellulaceae bacterium]
MNTPSRNFKNPWPRMVLACILTVWAGANLWSGVFRRDEIWVLDIPSRTVGLFLAILFAVLPLVIAIYLFWSIVVGPNDPHTNRKKKDSKVS